MPCSDTWILIFISSINLTSSPAHSIIDGKSHKRKLYSIYIIESASLISGQIKNVFRRVQILTFFICFFIVFMPCDFISEGKLD
jgi:hypothetical protein